MTSVHVLISGRVQGVGFRYWAAGEADKCKIGGWIRNRRDGCVEALFCGPATHLDTLLEALRRGAMPIRVDDITVVEWGDETMSTFEIRRTV